MCTCKGPITIRGTRYESVKHAARVLGISPSTIRGARSAGRLKYVGLGSKIGASLAHGCPVQLGPYYFPTLSQADSAFDRSHGYVSRWLDKEGGVERLTNILQQRKDDGLWTPTMNNLL